MTGIFKALLRTVVILGVIGAVGLGGMLMVAGQERTAAVLGQVQSSIVEHIDLSVGDPSAIRRQADALFRHAVDAAQVAAVGDRDAQVVDGAAEAIDILLR